VRRKRYCYQNTRFSSASFDFLAGPLVVVGIVPWLAVRSLAFNARNRILRNMRFNFRAGLWEAARAFVLWPLAAFVTLGLPAPTPTPTTRKEYDYGCASTT